MTADPNVQYKTTPTMVLVGSYYMYTEHGDLEPSRVESPTYAEVAVHSVSSSVLTCVH